jgi:hypothetical protein
MASALQRKIAGFLALGAAAWSILARAEIQQGSTRDQVIQELGCGESSMKIGTAEILGYKDGTRVRFEDGVVTEVTVRGKIGNAVKVPAKSPTVLHLNQKLAISEIDLRDRSEHRQTLVQGGQTPVGTVFDDERGPVLEFGGKDSFLRVEKMADLKLDQGLTVCAWFKPASLESDSPLVAWGEGGTHLLIRVKEPRSQDHPAVVNWCVRGDGLEPLAALASSSVTGQWTHVAAVYDSTNQQSSLFINGQRVVAGPMPAAPQRTRGVLTIGARLGGVPQAFFAGRMDEVRIITRVLEETEITEIMGPAPKRTLPKPQPIAAVVAKLEDDAPKPGPDSAAATRQAEPGKASSNARSLPPEVKLHGQPLPNLPVGFGPGASIVSRLRHFLMAFAVVFAVLLAGLYVFFCYCYKRICEKAGVDPGVLVWIPLLQFIPLFRAADLPLWMLLLFLVPMVNLVMILVLWAKICSSLDKNPLLALLLLVPILNLFLIPYLAFSNGSGTVDELPEVPATLAPG